MEKLTGLSVVKIDILRQSEKGKEGKKEAIFSHHIDKTEVKTAVATATILLTNTDPSMKFLGYKPIPYHGVGSGCLFASDIFHQTVESSEGTMKILLFLERCPYDPKDYVYELKGCQDADAKWNLSTKYLQRLQEMEGAEHSTKNISPHRSKRGNS